MEILLKLWDRILDITKLKIEREGWMKLEVGVGKYKKIYKLGGRLFDTREYMISKFTEKSKQIMTKILSLK